SRDFHNSGVRLPVIRETLIPAVSSANEFRACLLRFGNRLLGLGLLLLVKILHEQLAKTAPEPIDVSFDLARRIHNFRRVEDDVTGSDAAKFRRGLLGVGLVILDEVPGSKMTSGQSLTDSGGAVAQPDVTVAATGVAEFAEPAVLARLDEGRARRVSHRRT